MSKLPCVPKRLWINTGLPATPLSSGNGPFQLNAGHTPEEVELAANAANDL
jgi:hypothetical protein